MKVVITGSAGQLGTDLVERCSLVGDVVTAYTRAELDITDRDAVARAVAATRPDVVFNAAAWTAVDDCESDPERALAVNGHAVGHVAEVCADLDAHLVHVSTDYVFDGTHAGEYTEDHPTSPTSAYGRSKVLGEELAGPDASVVRTSWVCSAHGGNMVATIARLAATHPTLRFVDDQRGRPTFTTHLAEALRDVAEERLPGVTHFANVGSVSWFEFAQSVMSALGEDPARVEPISTADMPRPAPRPANSVLATQRFYDAIGPIARYEVALAEVIGAYR